MRALNYVVVVTLAFASGCLKRGENSRPKSFNSVIETGHPEVYKVLMRRGNQMSGCTASAYSPRHLITAAHCVQNLAPRNFSVVLNRDTEVAANNILANRTFGQTHSAFADLALVEFDNDIFPVFKKISPKRPQLTSERVKFIGFGQRGGYFAEDIRYIFTGRSNSISIHLNAANSMRQQALAAQGEEREEMLRIAQQYRQLANKLQDRRREYRRNPNAPFFVGMKELLRRIEQSMADDEKNFIKRSGYNVVNSYENAEIYLEGRLNPNKVNQEYYELAGLYAPVETADDEEADSLSTSPGDSGGPMLADDGHLLGVLHGGWPFRFQHIETSVFADLKSPESERFFRAAAARGWVVPEVATDSAIPTPTPSPSPTPTPNPDHSSAPILTSSELALVLASKPNPAGVYHLAVSGGSLQMAWLCSSANVEDCRDPEHPSNGASATLMAEVSRELNRVAGRTVFRTNEPLSLATASGGQTITVVGKKRDGSLVYSRFEAYRAR